MTILWTSHESSFVIHSIIGGTKSEILMMATIISHSVPNSCLVYLVYQSILISVTLGINSPLWLSRWSHELISRNEDITLWPILFCCLKAHHLSSLSSFDYRFCNTLSLSSMYHISLIILPYLSSHYSANISAYHILLKTSTWHSFAFSSPCFIHWLFGLPSILILLGMGAILR